MGKTIIHKDGAFNVYNSISDCPVFVEGVTAKEVLQYFIELEVESLQRRIKEARDYGVEGVIKTQFDRDIASVVLCNRAGPNEEHLSTEEFIEQFLTLPVQETDG